MGKIDVSQLATLRLGYGVQGPDPCVMQAISLITGDTGVNPAFGHRPTDRPACVDPALVILGITINDGVGDEDRQRLRQFIPRLIGTNNDGHEIARFVAAFNALLTVVKQTAPADVWDRVQEVPPITSRADARQSADALSACAMQHLPPTPSGTPWLTDAGIYRSLVYQFTSPPFASGPEISLLAAVVQVVARAGDVLRGDGYSTTLLADPALAFLDDMLRVGEMASVAHLQGRSATIASDPSLDTGYTPIPAPGPSVAAPALMCVEAWA